MPRRSGLLYTYYTVLVSSSGYVHRGDILKLNIKLLLLFPNIAVKGGWVVVTVVRALKVAGETCPAYVSNRIIISDGGALKMVKVSQ